VTPPPYFSSTESVTSVDRLAGGLGEKGTCTYPQDAPSRSPADHVHGSRAWELFVSALSRCVTELLRWFVTFLSRCGRMESKGTELKLLERLETEWNLLRKNLYAVSPDLS